MAISGQINGSYTGYANRYAVRIYYSYEQNQLENYDTMSASLQIRSISSAEYGAYSNSGSASISFGGYSASASSISFDFRDYNWHTVISLNNKRINHNADGTGSCYFSASFATNDSDIGSIRTASASGTITLNPIQRASQFGANDPFVIEQPFAFNITKYITDTPDTLTIAYDRFSKVISDYTSGEEIEFTQSELNALYALSTSLSDIPFTITIQTGDYGSNSTTIIGSITPQNPTLSATITASPEFAVSGQSSVSVTISADAVAYKSATIAEYIVSIGSQTIRANARQTFTFTNVDGAVITVDVVDSRGFSLATPMTKDITLYPYAVPTIVASIKRTPTMADTSILMSLSGVFSVAPTQVNPSVSYRYRESGGIWSTSQSVTPTYGTGTYSFSATLLSVFDVDHAYEFEITVTDAWQSVTQIVTVLSALPTMDIDTATQRVKIGGFLGTEDSQSLSVVGDIYEGGVKLSDKYGSGGKITELWNRSATSAFGAQTVTLSESANNYDFCIVIARYSYWQDSYKSTVVLPNGWKQSIMATQEGNGATVTYRDCTINGTSCTFGNGWYTAGGSNGNGPNYCIPAIVYGVKL